MFSIMANPKMASVLLYRPPRGRLREGGGQKKPPLEKLVVISLNQDNSKTSIWI